MAQERVRRSVASRVREAVAHALLSGIQDPALRGITITTVEMNQDLSIAKVYFRPAPGGPDEAQVRAGFKRAGGGLRSAVARAVQLRAAPQLQFRLDESAERADRIDQLLREIHATRPPEGSDDGG